MSSIRVWLFRGLVLVAAGLMLVSWFMPWWSVDIQSVGLKNAAVIHPYGLEVQLAVKSYVRGADLPGFFAPFMWSYLGLAIIVLLIGAWVRDKSINLFDIKFDLGKLMIGVVGLSYIVVVVVAVVFAAMRTGEFGLRFVGRSFVQVGAEESSWMEARLLLGYWLACAVGSLLVVLALLRGKIIGRPR